MPRPAVLWGAFGIIPYVSTASASIYLARQTQLVADGASCWLWGRGRGTLVLLTSG